MKIIHFSDSHVDFSANSRPIDLATGMPGRVLDVLDMMDSIVEFAEDEDVDLIIFAGDAFHRYNPNPVYVNEFARRIKRMTKQAPTVLLVGNHDMSPMSSSLEIYDSLQIPGVILGNNYEVHIVQTKSGKVQVATAPYPSKRLLAGKKLKKDAKPWDVVKSIYQHKLKRLGDHIDDSWPSVLVAHLAVQGCHYGDERNHTLIENVEAPLDVIADPVWDYVALGHIHGYQVLNDNPPVVYSGSIDRVSFGEENETKGFVYAEIEPGKAHYEFVALDARPYKTIRVKTASKTITEKVLSKIASTDLKGAMVRVMLEIRNDYRVLVDRAEILRALDDSGAYFVQDIVISAIPEDRIVETRSSNYHSQMTPMELLEEYMTDVQSLEDKEMKEVMKLGKEIINESEGEYVK